MSPADAQGDTGLAHVAAKVVPGMGSEQAYFLQGKRDDFFGGVGISLELWHEKWEVNGMYLGFSGICLGYCGNCWGSMEFGYLF